MIKEGRVVRVFDDEKIAINLGRRDGLAGAKLVHIYAPVVEIEDPESGEALGSYRHLKATGRLSRISEKFSIVGPTPRRESVPDPIPPMNLLGYRRTSSVKTVPGEFPVAETNPIPSGDAIKVGDLVEIEVEDEA